MTVTPSQVTVVQTESASLTASVASAGCDEAPAIEWSSAAVSAVAIQGAGAQVQVTGLQVGGPVTITAASGGESAVSSVTVVPRPAIALGATSASFSAQQGGSDPAPQGITITNGGGGLLTGLSVGVVTYGAGAAGWLSSPPLSGSTANPSVTLTLAPSIAGIAAGTYTATVPVLTSGASNSPQSVAVTLTVTPPPAIGLSATALDFNAAQGGANPAGQAVTISNIGGNTLSGLGVGTVAYGPGATGWLQAPVLSGTTASPSVTLTVQPVTGSLPAGTYTATIPVQSVVAANSPQNVTVTFTVGTPPPAIGLSSSSLSFTATQGGADPTSQDVTITNGGDGTLSGLSVGTVTYGAGASGWLQAPTLSGTTASPSVTLTVQAVTGSLPAGTYTATIPVQSDVAANSPRNVTVTFTVGAPAGPLISLNRSSVTFDATHLSTANPVGQTVTITNVGTGTLSGVGVGTIAYGPGASDWISQLTLNATTVTTSATLTLRPEARSLPIGSYTATVPIQSGAALNSPQNITVTLDVAARAPAIGFSPAILKFQTTAGEANPPSQTVTITNAGDGTLAGLNIFGITYVPAGPGWLMPLTLSGTTAAPSVTMTVQPDVTGLTPGDYAAFLDVRSSTSASRVFRVDLNVRTGPDPCDFTNATPIQLDVDLGFRPLTGASCLLPNQRYADHYRLTLGAPTAVQLDLHAFNASFDTFLVLMDASGTVIEEDDNDGSGLGSRIHRNLPAGQYIVRATTYEPLTTGQYSVNAYARTVGAATRIVPVAGNGQRGTPGANAPIPPTVQVQDLGGFGVAGVSVTFATVPGVGSVSGAVVTTDANGFAAPAGWTLDAGPNVLTASALSLTPAILSATGSVSAAGFNVDLKFLTVPSTVQLQGFAVAAARWQAIVTNDLPDLEVLLNPNACSSPFVTEEIVDDLLIEVTLEPIDGVGGILGGAGPCFLRVGSSHPILGAMIFDVADLATLEAEGTLQAVILHEMGHVLGLGALWGAGDFNLLVNPSLPSSPGVDTRYVGVHGMYGFDAIGGNTYTLSNKVPVENLLGGQGTRDGHWREEVLANELMTGFLNDGANPLSLLTVRSLRDMGYVVNEAPADPFHLTLNLLASPRRVRLLDDVLRRPVYFIDPAGQVLDRAGRVIPQREARER